MCLKTEIDVEFKVAVQSVNLKNSGRQSRTEGTTQQYLDKYFETIIIIIIINKVLIKVTLNKVIAGALYIVICG